MARRQAAGHDEPLAHLRDRGDLAVVDPLHAVTERHACAAQVAHHLAEPLRLEGERVVGALPGVVDGEVLLHHASAQHVRSQGHGDAVVVGGQAHDGVRESLPVACDDAQVQLFELGGVARRALHDAELGVDRADRVVGADDVLDGAAAGADEHRLLEPGHVLQERDVPQVAGSHLEGRHIHLGEEVRALEVEGRGEIATPSSPGEGLELAVLVQPELQGLPVLAVGGAEAVPVVVGLVVRLSCTGSGCHASGASPHPPRSRRQPGTAPWPFETALVVVPDLGDDVAVALLVDDLVPDSQLSHSEPPGEARPAHRIPIRLPLAPSAVQRDSTRSNKSQISLTAPCPRDVRAVPGVRHDVVVGIPNHDRQAHARQQGRSLTSLPTKAIWRSANPRVRAISSSHPPCHRRPARTRCRACGPGGDHRVRLR